VTVIEARSVDGHARSARPDALPGGSRAKRGDPQESRPPRTSVIALAVLQRIATNLLRAAMALGRRPRTRLPRVGAGAFVAVALTVAAIVASMFLLDAAASDWARHLPLWLTDPAEAITNFGLSGRFLYPLGFIILLLAALMALALPRMTQGVLAVLIARFGFLFMAIALPSLFDTIIKRMIGRARPYIGAHDDPFNYAPFIWRPDYSSMPSGHATTAAAAAIALGALWPRLRPLMWLYALTIMSTRVIINVHHPSDVLAGALVGVVGALMVRRWFAARGLVFFAGDLRAFPGPSWRRLKAAGRRIVLGSRPRTR
jgi:membrane-associated phospholipid phosphatase